MWSVTLLSEQLSWERKRASEPERKTQMRERKQEKGVDLFYIQNICWIIPESDVNIDEHTGRDE